jgi:hypothetical protein
VLDLLLDKSLTYCNLDVDPFKSVKSFNAVYSDMRF